MNQDKEFLTLVESVSLPSRLYDWKIFFLLRYFHGQLILILLVTVHSLCPGFILLNFSEETSSAFIAAAFTALHSNSCKIEDLPNADSF